MTGSKVAIRGLGRFVAVSDPDIGEIFYDFDGAEDPVAGTAVPRNIGPFKVVGQGMAEVDSGIPLLDSDGLGGVGQFTTTDEVDHCIGIETPVMFDVGLMAPLTAQVRVRLADLDTKEVFMGFTDINIANEVPSIQTDLGHGGTTTLTLTASDICGFLLSAELTDDEAWHAIFNGGVTTGVTDSTANALGVDAVAGEWDVLKLQIDANGTARWFINGVLKKTVAAAVSTSVDLKFFLAIEAKTAAIETMDVDYVKVTFNRDLTR